MILCFGLSQMVTEKWRVGVCVRACLCACVGAYQWVVQHNNANVAVVDDSRTKIAICNFFTKLPAGPKADTPKV